MAKKLRSPRSNLVSGFIGGTLLAGGALWLGWMLFFQHGIFLSVAHGTPPRQAKAAPPETQIPALLAQGITLRHSDQQPALSQQQALVIANQLEASAATAAQSTTVRYVLLDYPNTGSPVTHPTITNVPVWLVWYQKIPLTPADPAVDPTPLPRATHDLYVFLDANNGKELISIWA